MEVELNECCERMFKDGGREFIPGGAKVVCPSCGCQFDMLTANRILEKLKEEDKR